MKVKEELSMDKYTELTKALIDAKEVAQQYADTEDGGTCNFDSPVIDYRAMHMNKSKAEAAIQAAGLRSFVWNAFGGIVGIVVCGIGKGQGNRNTRMAEAAKDSLKASGIATLMYYQMD